MLTDFKMAELTPTVVDALSFVDYSEVYLHTTNGQLIERLVFLRGLF